MRQKKLSLQQLEHAHTARGLDGLYVSHVVAGIMRRAGKHGNGGADNEERNTILGFNVCIVVEGKEEFKAL